MRSLKRQARRLKSRRMKANLFLLEHPNGKEAVEADKQVRRLTSRIRDVKMADQQNQQLKELAQQEAEEGRLLKQFHISSDRFK